MNALDLFNKLSSRERKILYLVFFLLVVMLAYHGVWVPLSEKFQNLEDEIFASEMRLRKAKIFFRQKSDIEEASKKYPNLEQLDAGSDEEEIGRLLRLIEEMARKTGVSLSDVKPQQVKSDRLTKNYAVELNTESDLRHLIELVYELQYSSQMIKIEQIQMAPKEEKSATLRSFLLVSRVVVK